MRKNASPEEKENGNDNGNDNGKENEISNIPQATDYKKLSEIEHILLRPGMYIGSVKQVPSDEWILDLENRKMIKTQISLPQAVERLFLEVLSNAGDNVDRTRKLPKKMDLGTIDILMDEYIISITNGGAPMPVSKQEEYNVYVPELVFGTLRSSSNYDPEKERTGAGLNGLGVKLVNIFSEQFMVIVCDGIRKLKYTQVWNNNMLYRGDPIIEEYTGPSSVQVIYRLDFKRFGYTEYPQEAFHLFARHAADMSFNAKVPVTFNGVSLNLSDIRDYMSLYFGKDRNFIIHYEWPPDIQPPSKRSLVSGTRSGKNAHVLPILELCVVDTPDEGEIISFVNGMMTKDGGVHVNAVLKALSTSILSVFNSSSGKKREKKKDKKDKKEKEIKLTQTDVKQHLSFILTCRLVDPEFVGQTKSCLSSPTPRIVIPEKTLQPIAKWELIDRLYRALEAKQFRTLSKTDGKKRRHINLDKGEDANFAGGPNSHLCVLYAVEGGSAQGYAEVMIDLMPNGRDYNGIIPFKGKPLNVMNASIDKIKENKEFERLKKMLGLREGVDYTDDNNFKTLRYGHFVILADADDDGKHIIGLILNYFHCRFPSLLRRPLREDGSGFIMYLRTPIIRARKGSEVKKFYNQQQFEMWKQKTDIRSWTIKYYKGLGTSSDKDVADDFKEQKVVVCLYDDKAPENFRLAFDEKMADERKKWIARWKPIFDVEEVFYQPISDFIHKEFIQYSIADLHRSLPRLLDGLKVSQRKVLWATMLRWCIDGKPEKGFKKKLQEVKLANLGTFASEKTNYHHGPNCLTEVILSMTRDFVGTNNLPYFVKEGQFGTRKNGGKDAAAARYPNLYPQWWIPFIFKKEDVPLFEYVIDDGRPVEPVTFLPILPMQLINGSNGIGTGHSTIIPNHDPLSLCAWIKARIRGSALPEIIPWYRGFSGSISVVNRAEAPNDLPEKEDSDESDEEDSEEREPEPEVLVPEIEKPGEPRLSMVTQGIFYHEGNKIVVTELPIGKWPVKYRKWLESLLENKLISDFRSCSTTKDVYFEIYGFKGVPTHKDLRLHQSYGMTNMVLLSRNNQPVRYSTVADILEAFYQERLPFYEKRREYIISTLDKQMEQLNIKKIFISSVVSRQIDIMGRKKTDILSQLRKLYPQLPETQLKQLLTHTRASNFSADEIEELQKQIEKLQLTLDSYSKISASDLWLSDLEDFEIAYCKHYNCSLPDGSKPRRSVSIDTFVQVSPSEDEEDDT